LLRPRIIPCLLVKNGGLVKTVQFKDPKYVGDPINAVKIFNEKAADELVVFDIDATTNGMEPNYKRIAHLAVECRMPLCYGGGIKTVEQAKRIIGLGVEKIALSAVAVENPAMIRHTAEEIGSQSVVIVLDVSNRLSDSYEVFTHNATRRSRKAVLDAVQDAEALGAGEIVINCIDRDGLMNGYDLALATMIRGATRLPLTYLGGAGSLGDIAKLLAACGTVGAAAGSLFVFKGPYRAVLINYPNHEEKEGLLRDSRLLRSAVVS